MTISFSDTLATLEAEFGPRGPKSSDPVDNAPLNNEERLVICGGGKIGKPDDPPPVLALTEELALELWCTAASRELRDQAELARWDIKDGPHLDKWFITVEDANNTQRLAQKRYSVVATVVVSRRQ